MDSTPPPQLLLRLAAVVSTTWSLHVTTSDPNPVPTEEQKREVSVMERHTRDILGTVMRISYSLAGGFETIVIVARVVSRRSRDDMLTGTCIDHIKITSAAVIGSIAVVIAAFIRMWCYRTLGRLFTFQLALLPQHKLITSGPYAIVRHPSYTGVLLALTGTMFVYGTRGSLTYECRMGDYVWTLVWGTFVIMTYSITVSRCMREDELLHKTFGEEWERWSRRVRWRLVPGIF
ncbi:hypothetical protein J3A83DRAFT_4367431 [Scleroderma citrinum]